MTAISVVIPTRNRIDQLRTALAALAKQVSPPPFEIVVVNDGGVEPPLADVVLHPDCSRLLSVSLIDQMGVATARNVGAANALHPILGFLDDDTIPDRTWLSTVSSAWDDRGEIAAITGRIEGVGRDDSYEQLRQRVYETRERAAKSAPLSKRSRPTIFLSEDVRLFPVDYVSGGNFAIRRQCFDAIGGFDERYIQLQDRDLALRLLARGHLVCYSDDLVIQHDNCSSLTHLVRGRFYSGAYSQLLRHDHEPLYKPDHRLRSQLGESWLSLAIHSGGSIAILALVSNWSHRLGRLWGRTMGRHWS